MDNSFLQEHSQPFISSSDARRSSRLNDRLERKKVVVVVVVGVVVFDADSTATTSLGSNNEHSQEALAMANRRSPELQKGDATNGLGAKTKIHKPSTDGRLH